MDVYLVHFLPVVSPFPVFLELMQTYFLHCDLPLLHQSALLLLPSLPAFFFLPQGPFGAVLIVEAEGSGEGKEEEVEGLAGSTETEEIGECEVGGEMKSVFFAEDFEQRMLLLEHVKELMNEG